MSFKRLGDYIKLVDNRKRDLSITNLLGINISNNFMPSVANRNGLDLTKYKIISKGQFATNIMHVGRDERLPVALYVNDEPALVSPAYKTFIVNDEEKLLPEFLMIEFQRPEFHRLAWYYCDSSVRGGLDWDRFCEMKVPIPDDIEIQKKYVAIYKGLLKNQKTYENSLNDLQLICNSYIDTIKDKDLEPIGQLIELVDKRNSDGKVQNLLGVNVKKEFMPSKAKVSETSLLKYKIVDSEIFVTNLMHVGRDELLPVSLYKMSEPAIVSPAYKTFRVKENVGILPEFLMLWFHRPEFDRLTWYYCDSSVRGGLEWDRLCEIKAPVPDIEVQKAIVAIYHTLEKRKQINEQLKSSIKPLCPVLMKGVVKELQETAVST